MVLSSFSAEVLLGFLISFSDNVISLMTFVRVFFPYLFSSKFLENFSIFSYNFIPRNTDNIPSKTALQLFITSLLSEMKSLCEQLKIVVLLFLANTV